MVLTYAEVLIERTPSFPVVEALSNCRTLLSADEVCCCPDDRDEKFEALLAEVVQQMKEDEARKTGKPQAGEEMTTSVRRSSRARWSNPGKPRRLRWRHLEGSVDPFLFFSFFFCNYSTNMAFVNQTLFSLK